MSLFIKQYQITSNPRNNSKTTAAQGKHRTPIPKKMTPKQNQKDQSEITIFSNAS
jgi:hypothetical protein